MTDSSNEDSMTKLNTQLNKSMILMENAVDTPSQNHARRSITINTEAQLSKATSSSTKPRRSILKKSNKEFGENAKDDSVAKTSDSDANRSSEGTFYRLSRPRTLEEIVRRETLDEENVSSTFNLEDVSDSEDMWILDVPRSIDPQELHGQAIVFKNKSKFKIKDERYCIVAHNTSHDVTCVLNSDKDVPQYKTVNIKPAGFLTIRKKLSGAPEVKPVSTKSSSVQFPDNLKTRHPIFGVIRERKRRSKKRSSLKTS